MYERYQVRSGNDEWHVEVPLPGVDPQHVSVEAAGHALRIRVQEPGQSTPRYEQTFTVAQFLDIERLTASHRHGLLRLTLPIRESLKPRRISINVTGSDQKQLAAA
jgi:HSP20 family protein